MKQKLLIEISDLQQGIDFIEQGYGTLIINVQGLSLVKEFNTYTNEITILAQHAQIHNVEIFANLDMLYNQEDLIGLRAILKKLANAKITGLIINDIAIITLVNNLNLDFKIINGSSTLNTNYETMNYLNKFYDGFFLSNEINIEAMLDIAKNNNSILMVQVYGKQKVFYSKRKLLSAYYKYNEMELVDFHPRNKLYINEVNDPSNQSYIYEDDFGTHIYTKKSVVGLKYLDILIENKVEYFYLSNIFCNKDNYEKTIKIYHKFLNDNTYTYEQALHDLQVYDPTCFESFFNDKTIFTIEDARLLEKEQL